MESICEQPGQSNNILIGYNRGLMVLWNRSENMAVKTFPSTQQLEYLSWNDDGQSFISSHNDGEFNISIVNNNVVLLMRMHFNSLVILGSYIIWDIDDEKPGSEPVTTYGPFPCKCISKIIKKEQLIVFSGGLPRASYGEKFTVSVLNEHKHVVFDFTSKVKFISNSFLLVLLKKNVLGNRFYNC